MKKSSRKPPRRLLYRNNLTRDELVRLITEVGVLKVWGALSGEWGPVSAE